MLVILKLSIRPYSMRHVKRIIQEGTKRCIIVRQCTSHFSLIQSYIVITDNSRSGKPKKENLQVNCFSFKYYRGKHRILFQMSSVKKCVLFTIYNLLLYTPNKNLIDFLFITWCAVTLDLKENNN